MVKLNDPKNYSKNMKSYQPSVPYFMNCLKAFLFGGAICVIGQSLQEMYIHSFHFTKDNAGNLTSATLILISALLTGFGVYDKFARYAGAGSLVPVTGFANSITSAGLESKSEGIVLGIATNLFKLAGAVIVFGVVSATVFGTIRLFIEHLLK
ncbi:stage V sporulation protein AC [Terrilactibacillus sp. BCM23-1]|uniref:Stage V sporulation protein AC n=1 Tax=Terrilactibacillus tamarindi TaxID=2599694 RepID=A0A6N8CPY9_9BACI|nr:stage V sporulation protein AC [Terrilactibacillus tamarindi]MTT31227.1 stage V sporulation protein AC [Terrilactibacillus tamarindi]